MTVDATFHVLDADGPKLVSEADANDFLAESWAHDAQFVAIPKERLSEDFFRLSTGLLGAVAQKFLNYRMRVAIIGDISVETASSTAFRDFVRETNRGDALWFVDSLDALTMRLNDAANR